MISDDLFRKKIGNFLKIVISETKLNMFKIRKKRYIKIEKYDFYMKIAFQIIYCSSKKLKKFCYFNHF